MISDLKGTSEAILVRDTDTWRGMAVMLEMVVAAAAAAVVAVLQ
jgi:hypothetical protein